VQKCQPPTMSVRYNPLTKTELLVELNDIFHVNKSLFTGTELHAKFAPTEYFSTVPTVTYTYTCPNNLYSINNS